MSERNITYLTDAALITCIVQTGQADIILKAARDAGAKGAVVHSATGIGMRERLGLLGVAVEAEKDVVIVVVSSENQSWVFNSIYLAGKLDTPGMGYMYITPVEKAATYIPQQIMDQLEAKGKRQERS